VGDLGSDVLRGGAGADKITGNAGNDKLFGEAGDDNLNGGLGTDTVTGGLGTDTCYGETKTTCELEGFESGSLNWGIPSPGRLVSDIRVNASGTITDLDVGVDIDHPWVGDLWVTLTHVDTGTVVSIIDRPGKPALGSFGCSGDNIDATLDDEASVLVETQCRTSSSPAIFGSVRPNSALSAFDGEDLGGTWRLMVYDEATEDLGYLESWSLHFSA